LKVVAYLLAGWFIPGLGHFLYGKKFKAALYFILIVALIVAGVLMEGESYSPQIWQENAEHTMGPYLPLIANFFTGIFFMVAYFTDFANGHIRSPNFEMANTYILVAGFLNILVLVDLLDYLRSYPKRDQKDAEREEEKGSDE
jgi:hypothetical protein